MLAENGGGKEESDRNKVFILASSLYQESSLSRLEFCRILISLNLCFTPS